MGTRTVLQTLARRALAAFGWRVEVTPPPARCVIVVYPHTSNWDFAVGYLAKLAAGLAVRWIGKHTLFRWPIGGLLRRMGGIPVDRDAPRGLVDELSREFARHETLRLAIAPEGTRARTDHWKSGFYRLALAAEVPVGLAFLDYRRRVVGLSTYLHMTGDEAVDLARIRAAYEGRAGKRPRNAGDIRFPAALAVLACVLLACAGNASPPAPQPGAAPEAPSSAAVPAPVFSEDRCESDADCAPVPTCHPDRCGSRARLGAAPRDLVCTMECRPRTVDCGYNHCGCATAPSGEKVCALLPGEG